MEGKKQEKGIIDKILIVAGFGIFLGYMSEGFRLGLGNAMNYIFGPLTAFLPLHIVIFIMALITGLFTTVASKYAMDWELMRKNQERGREIQTKMRAVNKELRAAQLEENKYKVKKLEQKRAEIMKEQADSMRDQSGMMLQQFRLMGYTMPVVLPIFGWMRYVIYYVPGPMRFAGEMMTLPFFGSGTFGSSATNVLKFIPGGLFGSPIPGIPYWGFWYLICSILIGQVIRKVLNVGVT
ncbi:MAG: EMC3/TMCO1 family protein [Halobacteriota archaeon]|nr:EMC3/TMCO1 family protein [Halobacteriota archaeon]